MWRCAFSYAIGIITLPWLASGVVGAEIVGQVVEVRENVVRISRGDQTLVRRSVEDLRLAG